jgi:hypothetical protein
MRKPIEAPDLCTAIDLTGANQPFRVIRMRKGAGR